MSYYRTCHNCGANLDHDLTGRRYGRLTVISERGRRKDRHILWRCLCDCGNETVVSGTDLRRGRAQSCGCLQREKAAISPAMTLRTHGQSKTRLYHTWYGMRYRCNSTNSKDFPNYGGRGITICDEWRNDFAAFRDWAMSNGYRDDLTIDRIDNDKGYSPDNCRWATIAEQNRNKRTHKKEAAQGATNTQSGKAEQKSDQLQCSASEPFPKK